MEDSLKIDDSKILKVNTDEEDPLRKQILHIESEKLDDLKDLNLDKYSKIFVIAAKINSEADDSEVLSNFVKKVPNSREIFLQLQTKDSFKAFYKQKYSNEFKVLKDIENHENSVQFFERLNSQQKLLIDADICEVLNQNLIEFKSIMMNAIKSKNESYPRLLSLFLSECLVKPILLEVAESANLKALEFFMKYFKTSIDFETWCKMEQIVSFKYCSDFIYELHQIEDTFQDKENIKNLHDCIKEGDLKGVQKFVKDYPHFKLCILGTTDALLQSIYSEKIQIYHFLRSKDFIPFDKTTLSNVIKEKDDDFRVKIDEIHNNDFNECSDKNLNILASKCKFFKVATKENTEKTREILECVRKIEGGWAMMKVLAQSGVKIAIDFNNKYICSMTDNAHGVVGLCKLGKQTIYLAKRKDGNDCAATFAHEMTHYVCGLIYDNFALPYCKHDKEREAEFDVIFKEVQAIYESDKEGTEEIIANIFKFYTGEISQKCELIARVLDLLVIYQQNSQKLKELQDKFPNLFKFYYTKFLPDLSIKNVYQMIKLNNDFGFLDSIKKSQWQANTKSEFKIPNTDQKRILLVSQTPQLALSRVVYELKQLSTQQPDRASHNPQISVSAVKFKAKNIFIEPKKMEFYADELEKMIKSSCVDRIVSKADKIWSKFDGRVQYILVADKIDSENISKLTNAFGFERQDINFEWKDLTEKTQNFIKNTEVNFQGHKIKIEELFDKPQKSITSNVLAVLLKDWETKKLQPQVINCKLSGENWEKFIPRVIEKKTKVVRNEDLSSNESDEEYRYTEFSTTDFILDSRRAENFQNIVLILDPAGSGKTFLFKKLSDDLKNAENEIQQQECVTKNGAETQNGKNKKNMIFSLFLPLKSHIEVLKEFTDEGPGSADDKFVNFVAKMAKFDGLTKAVFTQKFSKGETIIFFDGFDEISRIGKHNCKENTIKLFKLFEQTLAGPKQTEEVPTKKRKIEESQNLEVMEIEISEAIEINPEELNHRQMEFGSMRQEQKLIQDFNNPKEGMSVNRMKRLQNNEVEVVPKKERKIGEPLSKNEENMEIDTNGELKMEQIKRNQIFITTRPHLKLELEKELKVRANKIKVLTKDEQVEFLKKSNIDLDIGPQKLVQKFTEFPQSNIICLTLSIPFVLNLLKELCKNKTKTEILDFNITELYKELFKEHLKIFQKKYPEMVAEYFTEGIDKVHYSYAIKNHFRINLASNLGLNINKEKWSFESLTRFGMVTYQNEDKVIFFDETFELFLIALYLFELLEDVDVFSKYQKKFLFKILTNEKFNISRMFLNLLLKNVNKLELFELSQKNSKQFCKFLDKNKKLLDKTCDEGLLFVFKLFNYKKQSTLSTND